jgi:hypothetical protein
MKKLDEADRRQAERASRGPSFLARWWSRGIKDGLIEGTHGMVKSVLIAAGRSSAGLIVGAQCIP